MGVHQNNERQRFKRLLSQGKIRISDFLMWPFYHSVLCANIFYSTSIEFQTRRIRPMWGNEMLEAAWTRSLLFSKTSTKQWEVTYQTSSKTSTPKTTWTHSKSPKSTNAQQPKTSLVITFVRQWIVYATTAERKFSSAFGKAKKDNDKEESSSNDEE